MKSYFGTKHKFTTSSNDEYIEISAGTDEHLRIKEIYNEVINSNIDTDILGDSSLSDKQDIQHTSTIINQGLSTCIGKNGSTYYIGAGLYKDNYPSATTGGSIVFSGTTPGSFAQYATVLVNTSPTTYGYYGQESSMNIDSTKLSFSDSSTGSTRSVNIYKRTGAVWAIYELIQGYLNSLFDSYIVVYDDTLDRVVVYLDNGTDYVSQQILLTSTTVTKVIGNSNNTVAIVDGTNIKIYQRTLTTWTLTQTIASPATVISIKVTDKFLIFNTSSTIYTYARSDTVTGTLFIAYDTLAFTNGLDLCSRTFTNGKSNLFVLTTAGVIIYENESNNIHNDIFTD